MTLKEIFITAVKHDASDVHIVAGRAPVLRVYGRLTSLEGGGELSSHDVMELIKQILNPKQQEEFLQSRDIGMRYDADKENRFRVHFFWEKGSPAIVARRVYARIPTPQELLLPQAALNLTKHPHGLVLVTGPTGHGKSTTLASLINYINQNRDVTIMTLEDPIEFEFGKGKAVVKQREIGSDTPSFAQSLRHIVRHDPDVIMVGEMRDLETMAAVMTLAETGHLVFSTLHTNSAAQTINRIIDAFPVSQQNQIRGQLAYSLRGVISQRLVPTRDGKRVAAREVLINTPAIANLIRENKVEHIPAVIQTGAQEGMVTMAASLGELEKQGIISQETVEANV